MKKIYNPKNENYNPNQNNLIRAYIIKLESMLKLEKEKNKENNIPSNNMKQEKIIENIFSELTAIRKENNHSELDTTQQEKTMQNIYLNLNKLQMEYQNILSENKVLKTKYNETKHQYRKTLIENDRLKNENKNLKMKNDLIKNTQNITSHPNNEKTISTMQKLRNKIIKSN